jgi:hypothetical protein
MTRLLIIGVPRSGTTWVLRVLGETKGATTVFEPDNHVRVPFAFRAKHGLPGGFYPVLDAPFEARDYERLWTAAFGGATDSTSPLTKLQARASRRLFDSLGRNVVRQSFGDESIRSQRLRLATSLAVPETPRRGADHCLVKSVYAPLSCEWVAERTAARVLLVLRHPLNILSSRLQLGWIGDDASKDELSMSDPQVLELVAEREGAPPMPALSSSTLARTTWLLGLLILVSERAATRNGWNIVHHEDLVRQPNELFPTLAAEVGLVWGEAAEQALDAGNRPGAGHELARTRGDLESIWRRRLSPAEVEQIRTTIDGFHLGYPFDSI